MNCNDYYLPTDKYRLTYYYGYAPDKQVGGQGLSFWIQKIISKIFENVGVARQ